MARPLTPIELEDLRAELVHNGQLPAIRLYRELTDCSLPEAMAFIDELSASVHDAPVKPPTPALDATEMAELRTLLMDGGDVLAIRYYREKTGASIEQAQVFVQAEARKAQQDAPVLPMDLLDLAVRARTDEEGRGARLAEMRAGTQWTEPQRLAAVRRSSDLIEVAVALCDRCRQGTLTELDVKRALRASFPEFSHDAYARVYDYGMRVTL